MNGQFKIGNEGFESYGRATVYRPSAGSPSGPGIHTIEIIQPFAEDDAEAHTELRFFLRAWQSAHPGVGVGLFH